MELRSNIKPWLDFIKHTDEIRERCQVVCQLNDHGQSVSGLKLISFSAWFCSSLDAAMFV